MAPPSKKLMREYISQAVHDIKDSVKKLDDDVQGELEGMHVNLADVNGHLVTLKKQVDRLQPRVAMFFKGRFGTM